MAKLIQNAPLNRSMIKDDAQRLVVNYTICIVVVAFFVCLFLYSFGVSYVECESVGASLYIAALKTMTAIMVSLVLFLVWLFVQALTGKWFAKKATQTVPGSDVVKKRIRRLKDIASLSAPEDMSERIGRVFKTKDITAEQEALVVYVIQYLLGWTNRDSIKDIVEALNLEYQDTHTMKAYQSVNRELKKIRENDGDYKDKITSVRSELVQNRQ